MSKYSEYEYMYSASKVSSLSGTIADDNRLLGLCDSKNVSELYDRLGELGIHPVLESGKIDDELTLNSFLSNRYTELERFLPDEEPVKIMRLRYDCHNLKTAIKCKFLGLAPENYYIDCGNISCKNITDYCDKHDFSSIPGQLGKVASSAEKELESTGNARELDIALDGACFSDMKSAADSFGFQPASELLALKIDLTNLLSAFRIWEMTNKDTASVFSERAYVHGGNIPITELQKSDSYEGISSLVSDTIGSEFDKELNIRLNDGLESASMYMDGYFINRSRSLSSKSLLGAFPVLGYIISLESEVKNLRIILSGVRSGADADTIRERLRM